MKQSLFYDLIKSRSLISAIEQQNYEVSEKNRIYFDKLVKAIENPNTNSSEG